MDIPFQLIDWSQVPETIHPGEQGEARWRTVQLGGLRLRRVAYSPGYRADHWCERGHVIWCASGCMTTRLAAGGAEHELREGMSYVVSDGLSSHWSGTTGGCVLFIADGDFLRAGT
jgi:hypothetical protein